MQHWWYLIALIVSLACLAHLDRAYRLVFFYRPKFLGLVTLGVVLFFITWDVTGISLDVFRTNRAWVSGIYFVTPNLPLEEFLFLTLLAYNTLLAYRGYECIRTS